MAKTLNVSDDRQIDLNTVTLDAEVAFKMLDHAFDLIGEDDPAGPNMLRIATELVGRVARDVRSFSEAA